MQTLCENRYYISGPRASYAPALASTAAQALSAPYKIKALVPDRGERMRMASMKDFAEADAPKPKFPSLAAGQEQN